MKQLVYDPTNAGKEITVAWNVTPEVTILHFVQSVIRRLGTCNYVTQRESAYSLSYFASIDATELPTFCQQTWQHYAVTDITQSISRGYIFEYLRLEEGQWYLIEDGARAS